MEGWVDLGYPAVHRPVELAISRSQVRRPNHYTTESCCDWWCGRDVGTHSYQVVFARRRIVQLCRGRSWRQQHPRSLRVWVRQIASSNPLPRRSTSARRSAPDQPHWADLLGKYKFRICFRMQICVNIFHFFDTYYRVVASGQHPVSWLSVPQGEIILN